MRSAEYFSSLLASGAIVILCIRVSLDISLQYGYHSGLSDDKFPVNEDQLCVLREEMRH